MIRKPEPKDAAKRIRAHLAAQGIQLSQRKALDLVALTEGFNSWQAMTALHGGKQAAAAPAGPSLYEQCWSDVRGKVQSLMQSFAEDVRPLLRPEFELKGPAEERDDEYRYALWVARKDEGHPRAVPMLMTFTLVEDEQSPGRFALRLACEDPYESTESAVWTSGPRFSEDYWSSTSAELLERLAENDWDSFIDVLQGLSAEQTGEYFAR